MGTYPALSFCQVPQRDTESLQLLPGMQAIIPAFRGDHRPPRIWYAVLVHTCAEVAPCVPESLSTGCPSADTARGAFGVADTAPPS